MIGDFSDPCSVGPIYCGCNHGESDVESVSIFSGSRRSSTGKRLSSQPMTPRGRLMKRISDYQVKGWLSQQEHRRYAALLSSSSSSKNATSDENVAPSSVSDHVLQELEKELDSMEQKFSGGTIMNKTTRISSILTPSNRSYLSTPHAERPHGFSVFPEPKAAAAYKNQSANLKHNHSGTILKHTIRTTSNTESNPFVKDPRDLHESSGLSDIELQELFTEMCFFARLGFVQPPCCLRCTYRESMKDAVPNTQCPKWVVWRKNAQTLLHPNQMEGNIVVVQCQAARRLLAGESIGPYRWDKNKKLLVQEIAK